MSNIPPRFGPPLDDRRPEGQGIREHARNTFTQRTRITGPDGRERELHRTVSEEAILLDGDRGQGVEEHAQTIAALECGCVAPADGTGVRMTPEGWSVCEKHYYICGRCGIVVEPVPANGLIYLREPFKQGYHRECCLQVLELLAYDLFRGQDVSIAPGDLLHFRALYRQLKREFPGPVIRLWRRITGRP